MAAMELWEQYPPEGSAQKHTVTGNVWRARGVAGFGLAARDIYTYLPPSYNDSRKRYPVLYMQDGQNIFDDVMSYVGEWGADEAAESLAKQGFECIIVAIPNGGKARMREYGPWSRETSPRETSPRETSPRTSKQWGTLNSQGEAYVDYVAKTVKPLIDQSFRTRPSAPFTGIGGSSMGALIALYAALTRPTVFGYCLAMSPSIWFGFGKLFDVVRVTPKTKTRFYMDMGQRETPEEKSSGMLMDARQMHALLHAQHFDVAYIEDSEGIHHESSWRCRFPAALEWFLNARARPEPPQAGHTHVK